MEKLNTWSRQMNLKIQEQNKLLYKSDYKFYKLDRLEKITVKIDEFSETCSECNNLKKDAENLIEKIPTLINGAPSDRKYFEKTEESFMKHLTKKHNIIQEHYFISAYSFYGIILGTFLLGLISFLINIEYTKLGILAGFSLGILFGRIYGKSIDKRKKNEGLVL